MNQPDAVSLRSRLVVKKAMERVMADFGIARIARWLHRDRVAILAYHNVVPDAESGHGDASLHMPFSRFLRQLDALQRTHSFVSLQSIVEEKAGPIRAVVTFDDAYRGAVNLALPELRRRGIPATMFCCPGLFQESSLWWDELAAAGGLTDSTRTTAMYEFRGLLPEVRRWRFGATSPPVLPGNYAVASADELRQQLTGGIVLGSHSWSHACLPAASQQELDSDLRKTLRWLESFGGPTVNWLALPYGEGAQAVAEAALAIGYEGVLEIQGGLCGPLVDRQSIPRINVPAGISTRGLVLRASGLLN